jgi:hypothetical protein
MIITIDGTVGSGKSTAAAGLARRLGAAHLDTGAMYRALTLKALEQGVNLEDGAALAAMAAVLEPGGRIVLLAPAFEALYGPIDRNLGHYRRYRVAGIRGLAARAGLAVRKAHYLNAIGFFGWWINAHILKLEAQSERQIEFFDRWVVPPMAAMERVIRPPFGQSVLAVLEKL